MHDARWHANYGGVCGPVFLMKPRASEWTVLFDTVSYQDQQELDACEAWVEKMVLLALAEEDQLSSQ